MPELPSLYLITDRHQVRAERNLLDILAELLDAGVKLVQLREKDLSSAQLFPMAQMIRKLTRNYGCQLLINDRVDIALATDADGVHLGGHSLPVSCARKLLGPDKLIGVSTHSNAELLKAANAGADFATFGPVFYTPSKAAFGTPVGLCALEQACQMSPIPVYGLGGIKIDNAPDICRTGAHGIALISALLTAPSPANSYQKLLKSLAS